MKKVGLLIIVVVLALGALGAGYAAWSETLTVNGKVSTGTYDVQFQNVVASETDPYVLATSITTLASVTTHSFDVTIANGYPGYVGVATFNVVNTGSVPASITSVSVTGVDSAYYDAVITGIATGDKLAVGASKTDCKVTITIAGANDTAEGGVDQTFTVTIVTNQGI